MKNSDKLILDLLVSIKDQAKLFIEKFGEFYPFASIVNEKLEIQPFSLFEGDDSPSSKGYLAKIEDFLILKYSSFAIGVNVSVNNEKDGSIINAIQIRVFFNGVRYDDCIIPYERKPDGTIIYYELYTIPSN